MNISSSGLLLESDSILMPGHPVMFRVCQRAELKRIWRPDLTVLADVIRSEVSKIAPDRFRQRVAARFVDELALLADAAVDLALPHLPVEPPDTPAERDGSMRATAARLRELARALESLQFAIIRICPLTSEATRAN